MLEEDIGNIELDYTVGYQDEDETEVINIAELEEDDSSYTTNI